MFKALLQKLMLCLERVMCGTHCHWPEYPKDYVPGGVTPVVCHWCRAEGWIGSDGQTVFPKKAPKVRLLK